MSDDELALGGWPVAILAGGLATRLRPITGKVPKALISVADEPFLAHQLRLLYGAGIRQAVLCVGYRGELIKEQFGGGDSYGVSLSYSFDGPELLGTGGALKKALPLLGRQFIVLYGDSYLPIDYAAPVRAFVQSGKAGLMTVFRNNSRWDTSNLRFEDGTIQSYSKKELTADMRHIDYGLGILDAMALAGWPENRAFDLAAVYQDLIAKGELAGYEVRERFYEIGSAAGLAELDAVLRAQKISSTT
jgi:Nucleoside-diphosphate-sugar pyrophosphorylase involved in lipopolysaccharide biosynthesis/translation initiation factor 2B, gamma/epsilon subunits (eIF-2Bgamma/eIF-2Bepsilon)